MELFNSIKITQAIRVMWGSLRQNRLYETLPGEFWVPIKDYEGFYEISTFMRVKDLLRNKILNQRINGDGYWQVSMRKNGKRQNKRPHKLFADAFMKNPENKAAINHKNLIKTDNIPCNIEWNTPAENTLHAHAHGAMPVGEAVRHAKLNASQVLEIYHANESHKKLARKYNVTYRAIAKIKHKISWTSVLKDL